MITEAGGLIGNFTGEADYLYQREVVAGNPKIYGQLVQMLAPYTRILKDEPPPVDAVTGEPVKRPVRLRRGVGAPKAADDVQRYRLTPRASSG